MRILVANDDGIYSPGIAALARVGSRFGDVKVVPGEDPMGREHYWFTVVPIERHREGTDLWAVENGYVSLTPLRLDLTHYDELARVAGVER